MVHNIPNDVFKTFHALIRKELQIKITKKTTQKSLLKQLKGNEERIKDLIKKDKRLSGAFGAIRKNADVRNKYLRMEKKGGFTTTKSGKTVFRLKWKPSEERWLERHGRKGWSSQKLYNNYAYKFGDMRSKESVASKNYRLRKTAGIRKFMKATGKK